MKLGVLHLSDIHFRHENDAARNYGDCIAKASYQIARRSDEFIIVVTGDIAFGGQESEYNYAGELLEKILVNIRNETGKLANIFLAPGNHDCKLLPEDEIRTLTIDNIIESQGKELRKAYIDKCTEAQKNYFNFEKKIRILQPVFEDSLWKEYELAVGGGILRISSINAAWMSKLHEVAGQLVFPIETYSDYLEAPCNLRLALIHHPLNWYCQNTYHPMRRALKTHCNAVLSGHEHSVGSEVVSDINGSTLMLEAPALQPHEHDLPPQFTCLLFETANKVVYETRFKATNSIPEQTSEEQAHSFDVGAKCAALNRIHPEFIKTLLDPGGNFTHPTRGELNAEEIFVYPQLEENEPDAAKKTIFGDEVCTGWEKGKKILILADDEGGKTFLLRKYFRDIHEQGGLPLYIKSEEIKSVTERDIDKLIEQVATEQYTSPAEFKYAERVKKVVLIDDIDRIKGDLKVQERLVEILQERFVSVILTASSRFKLSELLGGDASKQLIEYESFKIRPFGHLLRNALIRKWCMLGDIKTLADFDRKVHGAETLVNGILGKSIVPAKPVYLLIFLQSKEQNEQGELQNSSFSYYYQYLLTKSLKDAGYRTNEFDEMFSYLSQMAWFFKEKNQKELSITELREFNSKFSNEFTSVDFEQRIGLLYQAKIIAKSGEYYRFSYAYIYYFLVGKYLSDNLHEDEVMDAVEHYCEHLNIRENANVVMFLTHHSNDPRVINKISSTLDSCFSENEPLHFNGDMEAINSLVESAAKLIIKDPNVDENQKNNRKNQDLIEDGQDEEDADDTPQAESGQPESTLGIISDINLTIKTSEILANIVKNYYGSIKKDRKQQYVTSIFDSSLRTLSKLFSEILEQPDRFVAEIERDLAERFPKMLEEQRTAQAKKFAFQLVGLITTSFIARSGSLVSSDKIREDVSRTVAEKPGNAYRLIEMASCLTQPGSIPFDALEKLSKDLKSNTFTYSILQSLIFYHLHMFHTSDKDKQRLSSIAQISIQQSRAIDHKSRKSKADSL
ncbi:metallophosphoesterase [Pseudomonas sp. MGal98]|uniref:metallophosphoesterase n=1 Tax=Pseudomonas sp. MGal98 TaxID=3162460 RepID=UPI0032ED2E96